MDIRDNVRCYERYENDIALNAITLSELTLLFSSPELCYQSIRICRHSSISAAPRESYKLFKHFRNVKKYWRWSVPLVNTVVISALT